MNRPSSAILAILAILGIMVAAACSCRPRGQLPQPDVSHHVDGGEKVDEDPGADLGRGPRFIGSIVFRRGSSELLAREEQVLDEAVELLREYPTLRVEISGHTDTSECSGAQCAELGLARARLVEEFLADYGIDPGRIEVRSGGADEPIDANSTSNGRGKNRRCEFTILSR